MTPALASAKNRWCQICRKIRTVDSMLEVCPICHQPLVDLEEARIGGNSDDLYAEEQTLP